MQSGRARTKQWLLEFEQETARVNHAMSPDDLIAAGRDIESRVLARAVKLHLESRVMLNGRKTVVFG